MKAEERSERGTAGTRKEYYRMRRQAVGRAKEIKCTWPSQAYHTSV